jgi:hypothetical protein
LQPGVWEMEMVLPGQREGGNSANKNHTAAKREPQAGASLKTAARTAGSAVRAQPATDRQPVTECCPEVPVVELAGYLPRHDVGSKQRPWAPLSQQRGPAGWG